MVLLRFPLLLPPPGLLRLHQPRHSRTTSSAAATSSDAARVGSKPLGRPHSMPRARASTASASAGRAARRDSKAKTTGSMYRSIAVDALLRPPRAL